MQLFSIATPSTKQNHQNPQVVSEKLRIMVSGWRRTFRTSNTIPQNTHEPEICDYYNNINSSPKITSNFSFFSTPSLIPTRTNSPLSKHQCNYNNNARTPSPTKRYSPTSFHQSTPSSPNSPSAFSLLKSTLRLSKVN